MNNISDIVVHDANGQVALVVELKRKLGTSPQWAGRMRRNILAHGLLSSAPFFLLALPDHFYLWNEAGIKPEVIEPSYDIDPRSFLQPYYEKSGLSPETVSEKSLELIITSWLSEILGTHEQAKPLQANQKWLFESGLFDVIQRGYIDLGIPA